MFSRMQRPNDRPNDVRIWVSIRIFCEDKSWNAQFKNFSKDFIRMYWHKDVVTKWGRHKNGIHSCSKKHIIVCFVRWHQSRLGFRMQTMGMKVSWRNARIYLKNYNERRTKVNFCRKKIPCQDIPFMFLFNFILQWKFEHEHVLFVFEMFLSSPCGSAWFFELLSL